MASLTADFDELIRRVEAGRDFAHASFEQILFLGSHRRASPEVKRRMPAWIAKLTNAGWQIETFSIAEHIADILGNAPLRKVWLESHRRAPLAWKKTTEALANTL